MQFLGIDLGTTNCALACVGPQGSPTPFSIPQVVRVGEVAPLTTLPSFVLLPSASEVAGSAMMLPWHASPPDYSIGAFARDRGAGLPHALVSSAKSWLMAHGDKRAAFLPLDAAPGEASRRIAPVTALELQLQHLRDAWDHANPTTAMAGQALAITVPASFDPSARELVLEAAARAGLQAPLLLEEPLAAFYAWLAAHEATWRDHLRLGDVVLVIDIGGGTTDFSLIEVTSQGDQLDLRRVAVGDHILLGGDNMDALLAHHVATAWRAEGKAELSPPQGRALTQATRTAKEALLGAAAPDTFEIAVLGGGSKLLGQTLRAQITRADAETQIIDGFLPRSDLAARPTTPRSPLRTAGLPYAADPAITRHLAAFLSKAQRLPTAVLFNGGVLASAGIAHRITEVLASWAGTPPRLLTGNDLSTAVAQGAAHYGALRARGGLRVKSGTSRSYYIGVATSAPAIPGFSPPLKAVCVAPKGLQEGSHATPLPDELMLQVGDTEVFQFFAGDTDDTVGSIRELTDPALVELPPLAQQITSTTRSAGDVVPVVLQASVSDVGEFGLVCRDHEAPTDRAESWRLAFSLRHQERAAATDAP